MMKAMRLLGWGIVLALLSYCGNVCPTGAESAPAFEMSNAISDKCWIFTHLNKSGGTTLKSIIRRHWGQRYATYSAIDWHRGNSHLYSVASELVRGQKYNVIAGGYAEALRRSRDVDRKCLWFTVFRHPISRMVSAYYYCKRSSKDQLCASNVMRANDVNLATFAKHWGNYATRQFTLSLISIDDVLEFSRTDAFKALLPPEENNPKHVPGWYMVKLYLSNQTEHSNYEHIPDAALNTMLQSVQDLLRDQYSAVGILEEYNTTLSLFNVALNMPEMDWHEKFVSVGEANVNKKYKDEEVATLAEVWNNSEIKGYMRLDILLYEHAVDLLHQQAQAYGIY